jgi:hypothetical protein
MDMYFVTIRGSYSGAFLPPVLESKKTEKGYPRNIFRM